MFNNKPVISVIVPIYNGEKWLLTALRSISLQNFTDFEILLIDDGSVDSSAKICKYFLEKESRARYFYKENGGVSSARNLGLRRAQGSFIYFFDCDDIVTPDILSFLFALQQTYQADIVSCSYRKVCEQTLPDTFMGNGEAEKIVATSDKWKYSDIFMGALMCKLFSRKVIGDICFPEQIYRAEDDLFFIKVFVNATKVVYCPVIKAFYYIHEESATNSVQTYSFLNSYVLARENIKEKIYFYTDDIGARREAYNKYCASIFELFHYVVLTGDKIHYELLRQRYSKTLVECLNTAKVPLTKKKELKTYLESYVTARNMHVKNI